MNLLTLAPTTAIGTALTTAPLILGGQPRNLTAQAKFVYGSGGTTFDAYLQTSLDGGATWCDVCNFHLATTSEQYVFNLSAQTPVTTEYTPTDGTMTANTCKDGLLGTMFRLKYASAGTYAATTIAVDVQADLLPAHP